MAKVFQLLGESFINKDGASRTLSGFQGEGKIIALYYSAHWCPPCRNFTPKLAQFYENVKKSDNGPNFELIFISSDRTEKEFTGYLNEMPWYALPYEKRQEKVSYLIQ